jgi:hypothetical protein
MIYEAKRVEQDRQAEKTEQDYMLLLDVCCPFVCRCATDA